MADEGGKTDAAEDDCFERELQEAIRIAGASGSMECYARVLSGRLRQMDKRARAANKRADELEARLSGKTAANGVEIRPFGDGRKDKHGRPLIDEVVSQGAVFHIEQMDDNCFWFALHKGDQDWRFWMRAIRGKNGPVLQLVEEGE